MIESLVAFAVVSLGTVSVIRLQRDLRFNADLSGQRAEASHLGQGNIERERAAAGLGAVPDASSSTISPGRNTQFTIGTATHSFGDEASTATAASVSVAWPDSTGVARAVSLETVVASVSPALSAALSIRAIDSSTARLANRAASIPLDAKNLGIVQIGQNSQSAWKPNPNDRTVWLFDNVTGQIVSRCLSASSSESTQDLTAAELSACTTSKATLLSGIVRTSLATPPDASEGNELADALNVVLTLSVPAQTGQPTCVSEMQRSVEAVFGSGVAAVLRREAVPIDATPASIGASSLTELGDRFVAYRCVAPDPPGGWTGRTTIVPASATSAPTGGGAGGSSNSLAAASAQAAAGSQAAWTIGTSAQDRRVCRYVTPTTSGGATDPNTAHPAQYVGVTESLTQQNFLIVRGDQLCPGSTAGSLVVTMQQQP